MQPLWILGAQFVKTPIWFNLDFFFFMHSYQFKLQKQDRSYSMVLSYSIQSVILIFNIYAAEKIVIPWYYAITNVFMSSESQKRPLLFQLCLRSAGLRSGVGPLLPPAGAELLWPHTPHLSSLGRASDPLCLDSFHTPYSLCASPPDKIEGYYVWK